MASISNSSPVPAATHPNMVHEHLPLRFWEECHRHYKQWKNGNISVEDCFDMQQELYQAEMDKQTKMEEPPKSWDKYKKLDSLFEKIKSKTEEQRVSLENDIKKSKDKENKVPDKNAKSPVKNTKKYAANKKYILPKSFRDDEPAWLTSMVEKMLKSWKFIDNDTYSCADCGEKFSYMAHFEKHVKRKHTDYRPFACHICEYTARGKNLATDHIKLKHNPSFSNLVSNKVDDMKSQDAIITKKLEQLWMFTKEGSKGLYDCDYCRKENKLYTSLSSSVFEDHIQKNHPGYKPFTCNVCPFTANRRSNLTTHVKKFHFKMLANLA
jgi:hypothetical protein